MSLLSSMYTGISGLQANGMIMGIIGDNIANVNTIGFKGSRGNFTDVIAMSGLGSSSSASGGGTQLNSVQTLHSQGSLQQTEVSTDLAITGNGFFVLSGEFNGVNGGEAGGRFFSRAGQFKLDKDGYLVNLTGLRVQGF
jgi:flagellar hook protein FlgE